MFVRFVPIGNKMVYKLFVFIVIFNKKCLFLSSWISVITTTSIAQGATRTRRYGRDLRSTKSHHSN